ncbi:MAG: family 78 glycoside hydrolase catalytic domain, partial [Victivallaceae bacterium]|nr:family 78 glycoside hydrolase catalytic domain [Victivallaceae bacterium]
MPEGTLKISADTDFVVWLDGVEIGYGQYSDYPDAPTETQFSIAPLAAGTHVLAVQSYCKGESFLTACKGVPRVMLSYRAGDFQICSDAQWRYRQDRVYRSGEIEKLTGHLGFVFEADLQREDNWTSLDYDDRQWAYAAENGALPRPVPRPVPPQQSRPAVFARLIASGVLKTRPDRESLPTFGAQVRSDRLLLRRDHTNSDKISNAPGSSFLLYDLGREVSGFLTLECNAQGGEVIDLSHGEHLDGGQVRNVIGDYSFTDRIHCRKGHNVFRYFFRRIAARYLQLNLTAPASKIAVTIAHIGLIPREIELPEAADFRCDNPIWQ